MVGQPPQRVGTARDALAPFAAFGQSDDSGREYPDKLDFALLRIAAVCGLACIMGVLDSTVVAVAQRTFMDEFGSTQAIVSWTIAGYMLALATVNPVTGWAADRFGTKQPFIGSVALFTLGSLLCAVAPNIWLLILFRVVQGIGGGMLIPLAFTIMARESGPQRVGRLMALGGIPIILAPIAGPILGGWLIDAYGWKWIFLVNLPIGLAVIALAVFIFPKERPSPSETLDVIGMLLLSPGVAILLCGISSIPSRHTIADRYVLAPVIIGLALITAFVFHARFHADHPLIDLNLFKNKVVTQANVTLLVFGAAFVGIGVLLPSYFQMVLQQTPMQSGMHMIPLALGAALTLPIAGAFMDRHGPGKIVLVGLPVIAVGLGIFTFGVATEARYMPTLLVGLLVTGLGIGCTTTPLSAAGIQALAPQQIARGTTLMAVNQQVSGSAGVALLAVILTNQVNRNDKLIAANNVTSVQHAAGQRGASLDPAKIPRPGLTPDLLTILSHNLTHAYTTVFTLSFILVLVTIVPAWFLPKTPHAKPVGD
ncbi:MFS transporter [Mycobacterium sp. 1165196.3]|uniref:DHA2 family efflux MFS transporter permease subunit n=1 Tax=Mycobacterium sp. 1165196.3 TaxID=1834071 RepID=UPI000800FF7B|nr:DHA2 family efflux MFS transporter permease subunit [Mycobacterium sp. 1165196.3]OBK37947.1 MFS transporter [Mycobacterium sp. 1165196.3]